jgi:hypothetical protein
MLIAHARPSLSEREREARQRREEARALVAAFDYHGAIDQCLRNGWDGVLDALVETRCVA